MIIQKKHFKFLQNLKITYSHSEIIELAEKFDIYDENIIKNLYEEFVLLTAKNYLAENKQLTIRNKYNYFINLYENQTVFKSRNSTASLYNQFSTPVHISYLLGLYVIGNRKPENLTYFDPTAGNGLLTVAFPNENTFVNEFEDIRNAILRTQKFSEVRNFDASSEIGYRRSDYLQKFDGLITNPPFHAPPNNKKTVEIENHKITDFDKIINIEALKTLKNDGRAVLILDGLPTSKVHHSNFWTEGLYKKGNERGFFFHLYRNFNVEDVLYLNGKKLLSRQGQATNWRVILINGRKKYDKSALPPLYNPDYDKLINTYEELFDRFFQHLEVNNFSKSMQNKTPKNQLLLSELKILKDLNEFLEGEYFPQSKARSLKVEVPDNMDTETHKAVSRIDEIVGGVDEYVRTKLNYKSKDELFAAFGAEQIDGLAMAIYNIEEKNQGLIITDQTGIGKGRIAAGVLRYAKSIGKVPIFLTIKANLFSDIYRDLNDIEADDLTPVKKVIMEENDEGELVPKLKTRKSVDKETGEITLNYSPVYEEVKPNYKGKAKFKPFILNNKGSDADDPSIRDANGNIIYEVKATSNSQRQAELEKVLVDNDLSAYDCILATYSQFAKKPSDNIKKYQIIVGENYNFTDEKQVFLEKMIKDNIVVLDEAHSGAGEGFTAVFFNQILSQAKGVIYLSATYAKNPSNMPLYFHKTAMKDTGMPLNSFVDSILRGGEVLQEIISANLVESGNLIRRERPLSNVKFNYITFDSDVQYQYTVFDNVTDILRSILSFKRVYVDPEIRSRDKAAKEDYYERVKEAASSKLGFKNSPAFSKLFQMVNQTLFSMKAEEVAERAISRMKNGRKPVITFQNTMESFVNELLDKSNTNIIDTDFSIVLQKALKQSLLFHEYDNDGKKKKTGYINLEDLGKDGKDEYLRISDKIHVTTSGISISPIDTIIEKLEKAGFSVGEITGRSIKVEYLKNGKGKVVKRKKENVTKLAQKFNNNEIDCILLNASGSTGISLHAKPNDIVNICPDKYTDDINLMPKTLKPPKEVKQRVMIVAQPNLEINTEVQTWGRVNRSGQVYPPEYDLVSLSVPAEQRLILMLQKKLRSLDANTTSNQKQNEGILDNTDFFNKYGDDIVDDWLLNNYDICEYLDKPNYRKEYDRKEKAYDYIHDSESVNGCARKTSGRIAILEISEQLRFYNEVLDKYIDKIRKLKEDKEYDLEITHLNLEAKILMNFKASEGKGDNPFSMPYFIQKCEVNNLSKPFTKEEIEQKIYTFLNGASADDFQKQQVAEFEYYLNKKRKDDIESINNTFNKETEKFKTMPSLLKIKEEKGNKIYQVALQEKIDKAQIERNEKYNKVEKEINSLKSRILSHLEYFKVGYGYFYPDISEYTDKDGNIQKYGENAVFLGFKIKSNSKNPYAPSNIDAIFAIANGLRKKELTLSSESTQKDLTDIYHNNRTKSKREHEAIFENWDNLIKENNSDREERYIITGNILEAFSKIDGLIVSFNYEDGTIAKGILTRPKYEPDLSITVDLIFIKKLLENLYESETEYSTDTGFGTARRDFDGIVFKREQNSENFILELPSSSGKAAKFYKDEDLLNLIGNNQFYQEKPGKRWFGKFKPQNLEKILRMLTDKFSLKMKLSESQYIIIQKDIEEYRKDKEVEDKIIELIKAEIRHFATNKENVIEIKEYKNVAGIDIDILEARQRRKEFDKMIANNSLSGLNSKKIFEIDYDKIF